MGAAILRLNVGFGEVAMSWHLFRLSDEAWAMIEPQLSRGKPGKPRVDDRTVISGILNVLKIGTTADQG